VSGDAAAPAASVAAAVGVGPAAADVAGRTVLVTGGTRGIGRTLAEGLAARGARVAVTGRDPVAIEDTLAALRAAGCADPIALTLDLETVDDPAPVAALLRARLGPRLDALVLNAAIGGVRTPLVEQPQDLWRRVFQVNVHACRALLAAAHPLLTASDAGRVVAISTGVARRRKAHTGAYAVSKAAFDLMAGLYALETADTSIRCNVVNPGPTRTAMRAAAFPAEDPATLKPPEALLPLLVAMCGPAWTATGETIDADDRLAAHRWTGAPDRLVMK
jgi:NAD(P)-dependent dehydrogenase (short-subunit alcohol dehydrogenase family)